MGTPDSNFQCSNFIFNNENWKTTRLVPNLISSNSIVENSKFSDNVNINNCIGATYDLSVMQTFNTLNNYTISDPSTKQTKSKLSVNTDITNVYKLQCDNNPDRFIPSYKIDITSNNFISPSANIVGSPSSATNTILCPVGGWCLHKDNKYKFTVNDKNVKFDGKNYSINTNSNLFDLNHKLIPISSLCTSKI